MGIWFLLMTCLHPSKALVRYLSFFCFWHMDQYLKKQIKSVQKLYQWFVSVGFANLYFGSVSMTCQVCFWFLVLLFAGYLWSNIWTCFNVASVILGCIFHCAPMNQRSTDRSDETELFLVCCTLIRLAENIRCWLSNLLFLSVHVMLMLYVLQLIILYIL